MESPERTITKKSFRHELQLSPASVWFNNGFFIGHRVNYQVRLKRSMSIELESNGTIFRAWDRRAKILKDDKLFPLLNQSLACFKIGIYGMGKTINRNKQKRFISSLRLGYHFFQHATPYQNWGYWAHSSTDQYGISVIRSFQSHSISAGLGFLTVKNKRLDGSMRKVASHKWSLDYLGSVHYQLSSYSINDTKQFNIHNISNPHELCRSGARFTYNYTRYLKSNFGVHFGMETVYVPFLKGYEPTDLLLFVLRGGERLIPLFTNAHVGVSFVF